MVSGQLQTVAGQRRSTICKGLGCKTTVHMLIPIPLKHLVAEVIGYLKGKRRLPSSPPLRGGVMTQVRF